MNFFYSSPLKFYGPFQVLEHIGAVAYKVKLPSGSSIHDAFHVSQLKKHVGDAVTSASLPGSVEGDPLIKEPEAILDRMIVKRRGQAITKVLVKWEHSLPEDATWEFFFDKLLSLVKIPLSFSQLLNAS